MIHMFNNSSVTQEAFFGLILALGTFLLSMFLTPVYTHFAYKYHWWKKQKKTTATGDTLPVMTKLHAHKFKHVFPTMAGVVGVIAIFVVTFFCNWNRAETWLPLAGLLGGAFVGFVDDLINVFGTGKGAAGLRAPVKFFMITMVGLALGWFFVYKLGWTSIHLPFYGDFNWGPAIMMLVFAFAVVSTSNAVNISDGLDGLAGGLMMIAYGAFGIIALFRGQVQLFAFCMTVVGWLLSYVWFNVPPARFMMGDVGSFALGSGLGVVSMMTNSFFLLPIIGFLLVIEAGSSLIQMVSKKFFHRKIFISAPIHHHLEAIGWGEAKIVMRFWIIAGVFAIIGVFIAMTGGVVPK